MRCSVPHRSRSCCRCCCCCRAAAVLLPPLLLPPLLLLLLHLLPRLAAGAATAAADAAASCRRLPPRLCARAQRAAVPVQAQPLQVSGMGGAVVGVRTCTGATPRWLRWCRLLEPARAPAAGARPLAHTRAAPHPTHRAARATRRLREERDIKPTAFGHMVSATLYERRFGPYFCQPVIAGLEPDGMPYLCGMDSIGAQVRGGAGRGGEGRGCVAWPLPWGTPRLLSCCVQLPHAACGWLALAAARHGCAWGFGRCAPPRPPPTASTGGRHRLHGGRVPNLRRV